MQNFRMEIPLDDLKKVIWSSEGDKSRGPNGFNMGFFKFCWNFLKEDLLRFVYEFCENPSLYCRKFFFCFGVVEENNKVNWVS